MSQTKNHVPTERRKFGWFKKIMSQNQKLNHVSNSNERNDKHESIKDHDHSHNQSLNNHTHRTNNHNESKPNEQKPQTFTQVQIQQQQPPHSPSSPQSPPQQSRHHHNHHHHPTSINSEISEKNSIHTKFDETSFHSQRYINRFTDNSSSLIAEKSTINTDQISNSDRITNYSDNFSTIPIKSIVSVESTKNPSILSEINQSSSTSITQ
ncbi:uncharacterized protein KGF55_003818 [Candida pseudojiufengensis]|uniref:uncharacterized protein n=1 Tax=Candida pseudojiufengensis TaxID=497109 RepID=UPI002225A8CE|nr:uncharacterized protein KGF55_003818 [Candida pseudojiufengensis]KAI5961847.1 hypothetical protein KGF55_003818 [Candida pseudojiufengensis]